MCDDDAWQVIQGRYIQGNNLRKGDLRILASNFATLKRCNFVCKVKLKSQSLLSYKINDRKSFPQNFRALTLWIALVEYKFKKLDASVRPFSQIRSHNIYYYDCHFVL